MPLYILSVLAYFWGPVALLGLWLIPGMDRRTRNAFGLALLVFYPLACAMEYVYLYCDVWTFSELKDPLVGIRVHGAPIEEFVFWFGAVPFAMLCYLAFDRLLPAEGSRPKLPARGRKHSRRGWKTRREVPAGIAPKPAERESELAAL